MLNIVVSDAICQVTPWPRELEKVLRYSKSIYADPADYKEMVKAALAQGRDPAKVKKVTYQRNDLFTLQDGSGYFLPGLLLTAVKELQKKGIDYQIEDRRNPALMPEPQWQSLTQWKLRGRQLETLATITTSHGGIIHGCTGSGKTFIIKMLCLLYPTLNILICTRRAEVVRTIRQDIEAALPGQVGQEGAGKSDSHGKRIVITTTKSLSKIPPEEVHLFLLDECHCLGDNDLATAMAPFSFCRRFGFTATPVRSDGTRKIMEAYLGQVLIEVPYKEAADAGVVTPIRYAFLQCSRGPQWLEDDIQHGKVVSDITRKRYCYWRNTDRNAMIADEAKKALSKGCQVLIMVETLEHAVCLKEKFLHDVPVVHYEKSTEAGYADLAESLMRDKFMQGVFYTYALSHGLATAFPEDRQDIVQVRFLVEYLLAQAGYEALQGVTESLIDTERLRREVNVLGGLMLADATTTKTLERRAKAIGGSSMREVAYRAVLLDFAQYIDDCVLEGKPIESELMPVFLEETKQLTSNLKLNPVLVKVKALLDKRVMLAVARKYLFERYGLSKAQKAELVKGLEAGTTRIAISTMTLSEGVNLKQLSVLIRGDGAFSEVYAGQIPGRLSRLFEGKDYGVLIDFYQINKSLYKVAC